MDKVNNIIYLRMWKNTFNYKGTTKRLHFWIDLLIHLLITIALLVLIERSSLAKTMFWYLLVMIFFYLPFLSMATRRIRDIGEPPLLSLISLSGIGIIVVLILCLEKSKELLPSEKVKKRRIATWIAIGSVVFSLITVVFSILVGTLFYDIFTLGDHGKVTYLNTNIEDYENEKDEVYNANLMLPSLNELSDYKEVKYSYQVIVYSTFLGFESDNMSLFVTYEDNYEYKKNEMLTSYEFLKEPIKDREYYIIPDVAFVYNDYTYGVVMDYEFNSNGDCSSFAILGYNDIKKEIAYHYFYDLDLDCLCEENEDLNQEMVDFMANHFYYFN